MNDSNIEDFNVVCFANGTLIETDKGPVAVEDLVAGQMVMTHDRGVQPLRRVGSTPVSLAAQLLRPKVRPIRIMAGALGEGLPRRDLFVSAHHRVPLRSSIVERMFGVPEVFVPAHKLAGIVGIGAVMRRCDLRYFHLLFDRHAAVVSEGAVTESLCRGPQAGLMMGREPHEQIGRILEAGRIDYSNGLARACPTKRARIGRLIDRRRRAGKSLFSGAARRGSHKAAVICKV